MDVETFVIPLKARLQAAANNGSSPLTDVCAALVGNGPSSAEPLIVIPGPAWTEWPSQKLSCGIYGIVPFAVVADDKARESVTPLIERLRLFGDPWNELNRYGAQSLLPGSKLPAVVALFCSEGRYSPKKIELDEAAYVPGRWNSIVSEELKLTGVDRNHPLARVAVVIFGERVWSGDYYEGEKGADRVYLTIQHELAHALIILAMKNKSGVPKALSYPLWEALAGTLSQELEFCFEERSADPGSLVRRRTDVGNRKLGNVSSLINALLWGIVLHIREENYQRNLPLDNSFLPSNMSFTSIFPEKGTRRAAMNFLLDLQTVVNREDTDVNPQQLQKSGFIPDAIEIRDLLISNPSFLENYLWYYRKTDQPVFDCIQAAWNDQTPNWDLWGNDSFKAS